MFIHFSLLSFDPATNEHKESAWPKLFEEVRYFECTPEEYQEIKTNMRDFALRFTAKPSVSMKDILNKTSE